jgi:hypothetical protein
MQHRYKINRVKRLIGKNCTFDGFDNDSIECKIKGISFGIEEPFGTISFIAHLEPINTEKLDDDDINDLMSGVSFFSISNLDYNLNLQEIEI